MRKNVIIVELAGPAGAGKSTISKALSEIDKKIQVEPIPDVRNILNIPGLVWNAILLFPVFIPFWLSKNEKPLTRRQMIVMIILQQWLQKLQKNSKRPRIIILDQGPVYLLADLLRYGPPNFSLVAANWWGQICERWGNLLHLVICIDAPDSILIERIRAREKYHGIKQNSDEWARQALARYREAQSAVLNSMAIKRESPKVIVFNTHQISLSETVEKIKAYLITGKGL